MNLDHLQAIAFVQKLHWALKDAKHDATARSRWRSSRRSPTCAPCRRSLDADKIPFALGAQDLSTNDSGAYTGEISGAFLEEARLHVRHHRALRASRVPRRDRRGRRGEGAGGAAARPRPGDLRRRDRGGPGEVRRERRARRAARGRARGRAGGCRHRRRLRAGLGDRLRPGGDARAGAGGLRRSSASVIAEQARGRMPRRAPACCTADR